MTETTVSQPIIEQNGSSADLPSLQGRGERARAAYQWEKALELYDLALELPDTPMEVSYELLDGRVESHLHLGNSGQAKMDLEEMVRIAEIFNDLPGQIKALNKLSNLANNTGEVSNGLAWAESALALSAEAGVPSLTVDSLTALAHMWESQDELAKAQDYFEQALTLARQLPYLEGEIMALNGIGALYALRFGQLEKAYPFLESALALAREIGERDEESRSLNALGIASTDVAKQRNLYEESLAIAVAIGALNRQPAILNNLAMTYHNLGLYHRALNYANQSLRLSREIKAYRNLLFVIDTQILIGLNMSAYELVDPALDELQNLAENMGSRFIRNGYPHPPGNDGLPARPA